MSDRQRLIAAAMVFISGVFAFGALAAQIVERWQVLWLYSCVPAPPPNPYRSQT